MSGTDWVLTGVPRAGTSVSTRLLDGLPNTVALNEPLQLADFDDCPDSETALQRIRERFTAIRQQVETSGTAPALNLAGLQGDARVEPVAGVATLRRPQGEVSDVAVSAQPGFRLIIKQNALFTALLDGLADSFQCLALIRNPLAVLASWQTVELPVNRGSLPGGERYDATLASSLALESSVLTRQLLILDWFYSRFRQCLPDARILRFEDIAMRGPSALADAVGEEVRDAAPLQEKPLVKRYPGLDLDTLLQALLNGPTAWRDFYRVTDCERVLD